MFRILADVLAAVSQSHRNRSSNQGKCLLLADGIKRSTSWSVPALFLTIFVFGIAAVLSIPAAAQVRFGSVVGLVDDTSGAVISGATVKLTNLGTNETRTMQTSSAGTFAFPNLLPGPCQVEVQMSGFKQFIQEKVEVQVDVATRVNAALQVGNVNESV